MGVNHKNLHAVTLSVVRTRFPVLDLVDDENDNVPENSRRLERFKERSFPCVPAKPRHKKNDSTSHREHLRTSRYTIAPQPARARQPDGSTTRPIR